VETDKATVTFDATEEGYLAKILVGAGEIKVLVFKYIQYAFEICKKSY